MDLNVNSCTVSSVKTECFEKLTKEERELLNNNQVEVNYKQGETFAKQGAFSSHVIYLIEGLAKVFMEGCGENLILKIIPPGNLIGLSSLHEGNTVFPYSAQAYIDSRAQLIDIKIFRQLINQNSKFASEVINILSSNVQQVYGRFYCFENKQSYGRLADILLCLSDRIYRNEKFELFLTRKELAELAGMSSENVIRILKKFKDEGLIDISGKEFKIVDYEKLQEISQFG